MIITFSKALLITSMFNFDIIFYKFSLVLFLLYSISVISGFGFLQFWIL